MLWQRVPDDYYPKMLKLIFREKILMIFWRFPDLSRLAVESILTCFDIVCTGRKAENGWPNTGIYETETHSSPASQSNQPSSPTPTSPSPFLAALTTIVGIFLSVFLLVHLRFHHQVPHDFTSSKMIKWMFCDNLNAGLYLEIMFTCCKKNSVDLSSNLCGISGVKVWDRLVKGFPGLHWNSGLRCRGRVCGLEV